MDTRDSSSTLCPTGTISAGLTLNDGNSDTLTADIGLTAEYKPGENEWLLAAQAAYGEQSDEETVDNSKIKLNYRRLLCSPWFVYGEGSYSRDDIAAVDYRYVLSAGPGIYALKTDQVSLSFEAGPAMIWEEVGGESDERFALRFAERFEWTIAEGSKLWQSCEFLPDADDWDDYLINSELGAEAPLAGRISLRLLVKHTHDSIPAEGREKSDLSVVAGLGYGF
ncbi:MAG: DUF481 domain-containing protein [Kiritimatiellae bacterium]|nr:DUF481 domain-containing protein [Kiritimatiellia bacterium]